MSDLELKYCFEHLRKLADVKAKLIEQFKELFPGNTDKTIKEHTKTAMRHACFKELLVRV